MAMVSTTFGRVPGTSVRLLHGRLVGEVHNLDFFSGIVLMKATPVFAFVCVQLIIDNMTSC